MFARKLYKAILLIFLPILLAGNLAYADTAIINFNGIIQAPACTLNNTPQSLQMPLNEATQTSLEVDCSNVSSGSVSAIVGNTTASSFISSVASDTNNVIEVNIPLRNNRVPLPSSSAVVPLSLGKNKINLYSIYRQLINQNPNRHVPTYSEGQFIINYE